MSPRVRREPANRHRFAFDRRVRALMGLGMLLPNNTEAQIAVAKDKTAVGNLMVRVSAWRHVLLCYMRTWLRSVCTRGHQLPTTLVAHPAHPLCLRRL